MKNTEYWQSSLSIIDCALVCLIPGNNSCNYGQLAPETQTINFGIEGLHKSCII